MHARRALTRGPVTHVQVGSSGRTKRAVRFPLPSLQDGKRLKELTNSVNGLA